MLQYRLYLSQAFVFSCFLASIVFLPYPSKALAGDVRLRWDQSSGEVDGYRVFQRQKGEKYDYGNPAWEGSATRCTIYNLDEGFIHYLVVRAFNEYGESVDSNEVAADFRVEENPDPPPEPSDNGDISISLLRPDTYRVAGLKEGDKYYLDRDYVLRSIPSELSTGKEQWIMTKNNDKGNGSDSFLEFTISHPCYVYVAYDRRASSIPYWLNDQFNPTPMRVTVSDRMGYFDLYEQYFSQETIKMGGNLASGARGAGSNYIVIIQP